MHALDITIDIQNDTIRQGVQTLVLDIFAIRTL